MTNHFRKDLDALGQNIRTIREKKGLSQESLSFKADLHRTYLSQLESGQRNPSYTTLLKLANALSVSIFELINGGIKESDIENQE
ncbi:helix-turn-helix domain-containing protein [Salinithrix halophila]|uniref:Helix-turn-helix domain-containing protein n=1 Tax=Salinithrix halophila TaxID=1485204 RepID=A0ABV8J8L0_9BACL